MASAQRVGTSIGDIGSQPVLANDRRAVRPFSIGATDRSANSGRRHRHARLPSSPSCWRTPSPAGWNAASPSPPQQPSSMIAFVPGDPYHRPGRSRSSTPASNGDVRHSNWPDLLSVRTSQTARRRRRTMPISSRSWPKIFLVRPGRMAGCSTRPVCRQAPSNSCRSAADPQVIAEMVAGTVGIGAAASSRYRSRPHHALARGRRRRRTRRHSLRNPGRSPATCLNKITSCARQA